MLGPRVVIGRVLRDKTRRNLRCSLVRQSTPRRAFATNDENDENGEKLEFLRDLRYWGYPPLKPVLFEDFKPEFIETCKTSTLSKFWYMVNTYPQIWMEVNKTDRGNGGLISTPLRLHFGRQLIGNDQLKKSELISGAEFAFNAIAQGFSMGEFSPLRNSSTPLFRLAIEELEHTLADNPLGKTVLDFKGIASTEIIGCALLLSTKSPDDRHWERLGPLDWDDLLVEKFPGIKQKGVFNAVVTEAYDADLTVVYWAKVTSREHVQVYDLAGNFVAENTNGQQDHILKFQLELPSAEERSEPDFVGGTWRLADFDNFAAYRLYLTMIRTGLRVRPSHDYPLSNVWTDMVDAATMPRESDFSLKKKKWYDQFW